MTAPTAECTPRKPKTCQPAHLLAGLRRGHATVTAGFSPRPARSAATEGRVDRIKALNAPGAAEPTWNCYANASSSALIAYGPTEPANSPDRHTQASSHSP